MKLKQERHKVKKTAKQVSLSLLADMEHFLVGAKQRSETSLADLGSKLGATTKVLKVLNTKVGLELVLIAHRVALDGVVRLG